MTRNCQTQLDQKFKVKYIFKNAEGTFLNARVNVCEWVRKNNICEQWLLTVCTCLFAFLCKNTITDPNIFFDIFLSKTLGIWNFLHLHLSATLRLSLYLLRVIEETGVPGENHRLTPKSLATFSRPVLTRAVVKDSDQSMATPWIIRLSGQ